MKVCLLQTSLAWQDAEQNRTMFEQRIQDAGEADLFVLPEMFTTGFTMEPEKHAEKAGGVTVQWMKKMAAGKNAVITGSLSVNDNGHYYNRLYWVTAGGTVQQYDKRHLFRMGNEQLHYTAGKQKKVVTIGDWKLMPLICYDLRFPVWSRNRLKANEEGKSDYEYDVLIYVANWPAARSHAWRQLLVARAIENQCYVIGVNRVGADGHGIEHNGDSMVIGPMGDVMLNLEDSDITGTVTLDNKHLVDFRQRFPAAMDADDFDIHV